MCFTFFCRNDVFIEIMYRAKSIKCGTKSSATATNITSFFLFNSLLLLISSQKIACRSLTNSEEHTAIIELPRNQRKKQFRRRKSLANFFVRCQLIRHIEFLLGRSNQKTREDEKLKEIKKTERKLKQEALIL